MATGVVLGALVVAAVAAGCGPRGALSEPREYPYAAELAASVGLVLDVESRLAEGSRVYERVYEDLEAPVCSFDCPAPFPVIELKCTGCELAAVRRDAAAAVTAVAPVDDITEESFLQRSTADGDYVLKVGIDPEPFFAAGEAGTAVWVRVFAQPAP